MISFKTGMSDLPKYKAIHAEDAVILFFPKSVDIISMKPEDFDNTTEAQLQECFENFLERFKKKFQSELPGSTGKLELNKIMVNLADDCNMDCCYCYASRYYHKNYMSVETIKKVIAGFLLSDVISGLNQLVFFGGEPLLNLTGMEYFIDRIEELFKEEKISRIPNFNIITNGTIYSKRIANLFQKYQMGVLVSCDGPPELQNEQRPFRGSGKGSYDIVARNIRQMVRDKQNVRIECTVTKRTLELGYNHEKLKDFFSTEFGIDRISFVPEMITGDAKILEDFYQDFYNHKNLYIQALLNLDFNDEMFEVPHRLLIKRPFAYPCGLGRSSFHILANGDIYPCQLIAGQKEFKIADIDSFNDSYFHNNNWTEKYKENSAKCDSCWAKPLCKFCPLRQLIESNCYTLPEPACVEQRKSIEKLILRVVELRKDPDQWNDFIQRLEKNPEARKVGTVRQNVKTG